MNKKQNFDGMSVDELWQLHEELSQVLSVRLTSEKRELEKRLAQLRREKESRQSEIVDARNPPRERRKCWRLRLAAAPRQRTRPSGCASPGTTGNRTSMVWDDWPRRLLRVMSPDLV